MKYTPQEVMQYIEEEDVKFIRLAFCDVHGKPKNISIMPHELERAFKYGIAIDASAIAGFGDEVHSDLFLHPDPATIAVLPVIRIQLCAPHSVQCLRLLAQSPENNTVLRTQAAWYRQSEP